MRKFLAILAVAGLTGTSWGATGWYQDYILASIDGGADGYFWIGDDPSFGTQFAGANFGNVVTLEFGADMRYWGDEPGDAREGGAYYYSIDGGAFTEVVWTHNDIGGNDWQGLAPTTVNVAQGLSAGAHTVAVYAKSWGQGLGENGLGDDFLGSEGTPFSASFTVVPEPATMALFGLGLIGAVIYRRRQQA